MQQHSHQSYQRNDGTVQMTSDTLTNAGKHVTLDIACLHLELAIHKSQPSDWRK